MKRVSLAFFLLLPLFLFSQTEPQVPVKNSHQEKFSKQAWNFEIVKDLSNLTILSPSLAQRTTSKIRLPNGLEAYLISDPNADRSAAALSVAVGSWEDPKEYPGMAHFLEHMLFKGNVPYPEENGFFKFLSNHSGSSNAFTAADRTVYGFSSNQEAFEEAFDRFSHFFIDPLFIPSEIGRELYAVDQEHAKNIENDDWRLYQICKETSNPCHPFAAFSTGNAETLSKIPQETLKKWYQEHYSANLMHLVLYSSLPIEKLQKLAIEKFQMVPNRQKKPLKVHESIYSDKQKGHLIAVAPIENRQDLSLQWELPTSFANDPTQTAKLFAYILKRGQANSLEELLKKELLIENLDISSEAIGHHHIFFEIMLHLTDKGPEERNRVIEKVFEALAFFKKTPIPASFFEERKTKELLNYEYQPRKEAFSFALDHAALLIDEDLATYPKNIVLPSEYNPQLLKELLDFLTPENCFFALIAPPQKSHLLPDRKEKWSFGEYTLIDLPQELLTSWKHAPISSFLALPSKNPFLPSAPTFPQTPSSFSKVSSPQKIADHTKGKLFFIEDTLFHTPNLALFLHIKTPSLKGDSYSAACADLFINCKRYDLAPLLLSGEQAGFHFSLNKEELALSFFLESFREKAPIFLQNFFKKFLLPNISKETFEICRQKLLKTYGDQEKALPFFQAKEFLKHTLLKQEPLANEKFAALSSLRYEDFSLFQKTLFEKNYIEGIFSADFSLKEAELFALDLQELCAKKDFPPQEHEKKEVLLLPSEKGPFFLKKKTEALGSSVFLALQEGAYSSSSKVSQEILSRALHEAFFTSLRSKQKTAYIAKSADLELEQRLFQIFAVQSSSHDVLDLLFRFESFIEDFAQELSSNISKERFEALRKSLIEERELPPKNLEELVHKFDSLAFNYGEDFSWILKEIDALKKLTYEEFLAFSSQNLSRNNKGRIAILFEGKSSPTNSFIYKDIAFQELAEQSSYVTAPSTKSSPTKEEETTAANDSLSR